MFDMTLGTQILVLKILAYIQLGLCCIIIYWIINKHNKISFLIDIIYASSITITNIIAILIVLYSNIIE